MKSRRRFLTDTTIAATALGASALPGAAGRLAARTATKVFTPEAFGAKGDGVSDDSAAMGALAAAVNANGGGRVRFRRTTYRVGTQVAPPAGSENYYRFPVPLLEFKGCTKELTIEGNGARLRCNDGLFYGIFDGSGRAERHPMPYLGPGVGIPYRHMIKIEECSGPVLVENIELDGNLERLRIGGEYGDTGWQLPMNGLGLFNNKGPERVRNVYTHHHAGDGFYIDGLDSEEAEQVQREVSQLRAEYNGRQGCSIVGGRGYRFEDCRFKHTGRGQVASKPGAGVDLEAEADKLIRNISFADCEFSDNFGCGLVADMGDTRDVTITRCTFIGTVNWSCWPCKPGFRFDQCTFAGALVRAFGGKDRESAAQFRDCKLTDDPSLSPTGSLFGGENSDRPLADLSDTDNILFHRCAFLATHTDVLPWSVGAIYADCRMEQRSKAVSFPRGIYLGRTVINGIANLTGSTIAGEVILNGRRYAGVKV